VREDSEHAIGGGADAAAVAYVEVLTAGRAHFGAGRDRSIVTASLRAIISSVNRAVRLDGLRCSGMRGSMKEGHSAEVAV
jgi:2-isopropylmalate synthase